MCFSFLNRMAPRASSWPIASLAAHTKKGSITRKASHVRDALSGQIEIVSLAGCCSDTSSA